MLEIFSFIRSIYTIIGLFKIVVNALQKKETCLNNRKMLHKKNTLLFKKPLRIEQISVRNFTLFLGALFRGAGLAPYCALFWQLFQ